jgi:hypothetical protein
MLVVVGDPTKDLPALHVALRRCTKQRNRTALVKALVGSASVVERDILGQYAVKMPLVQDKQPIPALLASRANRALRHVVRVGCPIGVWTTSTPLPAKTRSNPA